MNITILDGITLNPGDLSWERFNALGKVKVYKHTPAHLITERSIDADILLVNKVLIQDTVLAQLPNLKYIAITATGYNNIDLIAAKKRGIPVSNIQGYGTNSVAQHTFALLLALTNKVAEHHQSIQAGQWHQTKEFTFWNYPLVELVDKTMGIVGFGKIGQQTARIALAFGMKVLVFHKHPERDAKAVAGVVFVDIATLFKQSDVVSLHLPLTANNAGFVNSHLLNTMKKTAYLLNTSRGALINETDLAEALNQGTIAGAGLDVLSVEPPVGEVALIKAQNCIITPHNAWASYESRSRMMDILFHNIQSYLQGEAQNLIGV